MSGSGGNGQHGMSLVELMVVLGMATAIIFVFAHFILSTRQAVSRQEAGGEMVQRNLRIASNLRSGLQSCEEFVTAYSDSTGSSMLPLHAMIASSVAASSLAGTGAVPQPVAFTCWPTASAVAMVDMSGDAMASAWGDEILYVAALNPLTFTAYYTGSGNSWTYACGGAACSSSQTTAAVGETISVDRLQFVYDYLSLDATHILGALGAGLRLAEWRSQPFIDFNSLNTLINAPPTGCCPRLTAACTYLPTLGYSYCFNTLSATAYSSGATSGCFYALTSSNIQNYTSTSLTVVAMGSWGYLDDFDTVQSYQVQVGTDLGRISRANGYTGGQTGAPSNFSLAYNSETVSPGLTLVGPSGVLQVPKFAVANQLFPQTPSSLDMGGVGFPGGFEVAIGGQPGSREVFFRIVHMVQNEGSFGNRTYQALETTSEISVAPNADF